MPTSEQIEKAAQAITEASDNFPYAQAQMNDAMAEAYATAALSAAEGVKPREMVPVPAEMSLELMKSINFENQVLAYEKGSYFNAWMVFDEYEGGWFWMNESDNEPTPSHYCPLPCLSALQEGE